jgi:chromosome segregation ATPase
MQAALASKEQMLQQACIERDAASKRLKAIETHGGAGLLSISDSAMLRKENAACVAELSSAIAELAAIRTHLAGSIALSTQLRNDLQAAVDQRNLLYCEHATEVTSLSEQVATTREEAASAKDEVVDLKNEVQLLREKLLKLPVAEEAKQAVIEMVMLKLSLDRVRIWNAAHDVHMLLFLGHTEGVC